MWAVLVLNVTNYFPYSKVHGANMAPTWVLSAPSGPHVGPINLAIRVIHIASILSMYARTMVLQSHTSLRYYCTFLFTHIHIFFYIFWYINTFFVWFALFWNSIIFQPNTFVLPYPIDMITRIVLRMRATNGRWRYNVTGDSSSCSTCYFSIYMYMLSETIAFKSGFQTAPYTGSMWGEPSNTLR